MREHLASDAVAHVIAKEPFGQAVSYLRNYFDHLLVYLDDGLMPIATSSYRQEERRLRAMPRRSSEPGEAPPARA